MTTSKQLIKSTQPQHKDVPEGYKTPLGQIGYDNVRDDLEKTKNLRETTTRTFTMPPGAVNGYVLTTDANGVGTWQEAKTYWWLDTTTAQFDAGTKSGTATITDEYTHTANQIQLSFPYADKDANLVSYWRFENNLLDETGTNNGVSTTADYTASGKFGGCYDYEKTNTDFTQLGSDLFETDNVGTISFWVNVESFVGGDVVFSHQVSTSRNWLAVRIWTGGTYLMQWYDGTTNNAWVGDTTTSIGAWTHIVVTSDGADWFIYINGTLQTLTAIAGTNTGQWFNDMTGTHDDRLGRLQYDTTSNLWFDGKIDEVKYYSRQLSTAEVTTLYNSGNQYTSTGNFKSEKIKMPESSNLNVMTITLTGASATYYVDKVEILSAADAVLSTSNTNITANGANVVGDWSSALNTITQDFKYKIYLAGDGAGSCAVTDVKVSFKK